MTKERLKRKVIEAIDNCARDIHEFNDDIFSHPELGYKEFRTTEKVSDFLEKLGLEVERNLAITGCRAYSKIKKAGPTLCIMGELDSVITFGHKDAKEDGACHSCGHNVQLAAMLGAALGLVKSGVLEVLDGSVEFFGVPAEEFIELDFRTQLIEEGKIKYAGGKQELIHRGYFDNIQIAMMMHVESNLNGSKASIGTGSNGFVGKKIKFMGKGAHSGATPHLGVNALNAASLALNNINAQRETFRDEDHIRVHPIITKGGDIVNVVPADVRMETYVRGKTLESINSANHKVNNCIKAGALAMGAGVEIQEIPGYLPLKSCRELDKIFKSNLLNFLNEEEISEGGAMAGSTDFGDITHIMPAIHPMIGGVRGALHTRDYEFIDRDLAYIIPAKAFAMTVIDLLYDDAKLAKNVIGNFKAPMSIKEYLDFLEKNSSGNFYSYE